MKRLLFILLLFPLFVQAQTPYYSKYTGKKIDTLLTNVDNAKVFNVKSYGAKGDGIANDLPAFIAACADAAAVGGGVIYAPSGKYKLADGHGGLYPLDGVSIVGDAPATYLPDSYSFAGGTLIMGNIGIYHNGTSVRNVSLIDSTAPQIIGISTGSSNTTIDNVTIVGWRANNPNHGILVGAGQNTNITNLKVYRCYHGLAIRASDVVVNNFFAQDCGGSGITIASGTGEVNKNIILSNVIVTSKHDTTGDGLWILMEGDGEAIQNVSVSNFAIDTVAGQGIYINSNRADSAQWRMKNISINGGVIQHVGGGGLSTYRASNVSVSNVRVNHASSGFGLWQSKNFIFSNCLSDTTYSFGWTNDGGSQNIKIYNGTYVYSGGSAINDAEGAFVVEQINGTDLIPKVSYSTVGSSTGPRYIMTSTNPSANNQRWDMTATGGVGFGVLQERAISDDDYTASVWLDVLRIGMTIGAINFYSPKISQSSGDPTFQLYNTNGAANQQRWDFQATGTHLYGKAELDDETNATNWLDVVRSGMTPLSITFDAPVYLNSGSDTAATKANVRADTAGFAAKFALQANATSATSGTMTVSMTSSVVTITPAGDCTFNCSGGITGQRVTFCITTSGATPYTLTWNTGYKSTGTLSTGSVSGKKFTVSFVLVDGANWCEVSRTGAM